MKTILSIFLILTWGAAAEPTNRSNLVKNNSHALQNQASDREGGETIEDAVPILSFPFLDTGATCDNIDDYDSACPYDGSLSPDVVYSFTPGGDTVVNIDLCYSLYDTKVYVLNQAQEEIACNDDFYTGPPCGSYVSYIPDLPLYGGETYYIVVDGYGDDCGEYQIHIFESLPCCIDCPPEGVQENEPELQDGYVDNYNGDCSSDPVVFQPLVARPDGCVDLCGISGWYFTGSNSSRDTDCSDLVMVAEAQGISYEPVEVVFPSVAGQVYWVWGGPMEYAGWLNEFEYLLTVCGLDGPVSVQPITWGGLKSLYR